ncbi:MULTISPECIES: hypothetical protein [Turicibacter]|jgi:hypothetical protein|uniref:Uncharacterized protein n=2 Tax=Turicibacter sanguinis TaxID=154288 RepID=A0A9X4XFB7_9FIRM|nr:MULTISPECIES: hypothetical protein [Turicibacter]EFF63253.1 hypothetical protein CUW_0831 [Turicibacter sanguinis PC909]EGC92484.1 hypothetical protein HMPREF9402_1181 [Turicibacter sp. HGF1]MBP3904075.1 hypothetical protein [Turicibacter sp.]MCU7191937.1 hypothetical protein [Turicibacter sanguinis]MCU7196788.1 hypothetical protein [Turicibacter sanguinis]
MLKSETLKIIEFAKGEIKKPVLIRYTITVDLNSPKVYDEDALKLIGSVKTLPDNIYLAEFVYEVTDSRLTHLNRQKITIKINEKNYFTLVLDDDLDIFFSLLRLYKNYEAEVEAYEQTITQGMLLKVLETYYS